MKYPYHSALKTKKPLEINKGLDYIKVKGNIALYHDLCEGPLPKPFNKCDVFYSEPAWQQGYPIFLKRANKNDSDYERYISSLNNIIEQHKSNKPIWLIIGSHVLKRINPPERILKVNLQVHGYNTNLCGWNDSHSYNFSTNYQFISELAKKYNCVGDFCCGYGNTGRIFQEQGKEFVMSDFNPKCIYYIAKTFMEVKQCKII